MKKILLNKLIAELPEKLSDKFFLKKAVGK
jgi:hypothetical protein